PLSPQQLHEWFAQRTRLRHGAAGAGDSAARDTGAGGVGATRLGGVGVNAGAGGTGGAAGAGRGGARTSGTGGAETGSVGGAGAGGARDGDPAQRGGAGAGGAGARGTGAGDAGAGGAGGGDTGAVGAGAGGTGAGGTRAGGAGVGDTGAGDPGAGGAGAGGAVSGGTGARGTVWPRPFSFPCFSTPDPESDSLRAASPSVTRFLATTVTDPLFESSAASALVAELVDFAAACRLDYAASLVAESVSASVCPPYVGGECFLGTDVLEDRQEELECFAAASPHLMSMLLVPEGDPDALDIPTPRSYAEAIEGPYSSQWQAAMDAEMASWKSTGTYVDEVPPPGANIVSGMWIFRVKRPPGSPPAFKARYVARGFSQRQGVDFFQNFSPTPKMTTLQWSLRRPVYGLRQAPCELHDTFRTTLASFGFAPSTADPSLFLRTDATLPPFYVLVYVDDLVFATADTEALALVKSELQKRHTCTDLGELTSYLGLRITLDRAQHTITLTQSHMVQQVLQRFGFTYSSPQSTPLPTSHSLSAPHSDESVEPSGPYPELVGCLMYLMTCTRPDLAYPLSLLARYVAPGRHRK
ncbi:unnamed protein product, partial [Closterium sp. NIES-53]